MSTPLLHPAKIRELKEIMRRDYGVEISTTDANQLGISLLRLAKTSMTVQLRKERFGGRKDLQTESKTV